MTREEAIKRLKDLNEDRTERVVLKALNMSDRPGMAIEMAIEALEKQIPKKPICYEDKYMHCPSCDEGFGYNWNTYPTKNNLALRQFKHCICCGQAIDWSESEES